MAESNDAMSGNGHEHDRGENMIGPSNMPPTPLPKRNRRVTAIDMIDKLYGPAELSSSYTPTAHFGVSILQTTTSPTPSPPPSATTQCVNQGRKISMPRGLRKSREEVMREVEERRKAEEKRQMGSRVDAMGTTELGKRRRDDDIEMDHSLPAPFAKKSAPRDWEAKMELLEEKDEQKKERIRNEQDAKIEACRDITRLKRQLSDAHEHIDHDAEVRQDLFDKIISRDVTIDKLNDRIRLLGDPIKQRDFFKKEYEDTFDQLRETALELDKVREEKVDMEAENSVQKTRIAELEAANSSGSTQLTNAQQELLKNTKEFNDMKKENENQSGSVQTELIKKDEEVKEAYRLIERLKEEHRARMDEKDKDIGHIHDIAQADLKKTNDVSTQASNSRLELVATRIRMDQLTTVANEELRKRDYEINRLSSLVQAQSADNGKLRVVSQIALAAVNVESLDSFKQELCAIYDKAFNDYVQEYQLEAGRREAIMQRELEDLRQRTSDAENSVASGNQRERELINSKSEVEQRAFTTESSLILANQCNAHLYREKFDLERSVEKINQTANGYYEKLIKARDEIHGLATEKLELEQRVASKQSQLNELDKRINELESQNQDQETLLEEYKNNATETYTLLRNSQSEISDLKMKISSLEGTVLSVRQENNKLQVDRALLSASGLEIERLQRACTRYVDDRDSQAQEIKRLRGLIRTSAKICSSGDTGDNKTSNCNAQWESQDAFGDRRVGFDKSNDQDDHEKSPPPPGDAGDSKSGGSGLPRRQLRDGSCSKCRTYKNRALREEKFYRQNLVFLGLTEEEFISELTVVHEVDGMPAEEDDCEIGCITNRSTLKTFEKLNRLTKRHKTKLPKKKECSSSVAPQDGVIIAEAILPQAELSQLIAKLPTPENNPLSSPPTTPTCSSDSRTCPEVTNNDEPDSSPNAERSQLITIFPTLENNPLLSPPTTPTCSSDSRTCPEVTKNDEPDSSPNAERSQLIATFPTLENNPLSSPPTTLTCSSDSHTSPEATNDDEPDSSSNGSSVGPLDEATKHILIDACPERNDHPLSGFKGLLEVDNPAITWCGKFFFWVVVTCLLAACYQDMGRVKDRSPLIMRKASPTPTAPSSTVSMNLESTGTFSLPNAKAGWKSIFSQW